MTNPLSAFWAHADLRKPPYVHPDDRLVFERFKPGSLKHPAITSANCEDYLPTLSDRFIHFSLLPVPYVGDLERADIFVLMLNPGFSQREYMVEARPEIDAALRANLAQSHINTAPMLYLDALFGDHPGQQYWQKRLKGSGSYKELAKRLAVLEVFPYHSEADSARSLVEKLPSSQVAREFVHNYLVPKAQRGDILLVVPRAKTQWGVREEDISGNIVVHGQGLNASGLLTPGTPGGQSIINWLASPQGISTGKAHAARPTVRNKMRPKTDASKNVDSGKKTTGYERADIEDFARKFLELVLEWRLEYPGVQGSEVFNEVLCRYPDQAYAGACVEVSARRKQFTDVLGRVRRSEYPGVQFTKDDPNRQGSPVRFYVATTG